MLGLESRGVLSLEASGWSSESDKENAGVNGGAAGFKVVGGLVGFCGTVLFTGLEDKIVGLEGAVIERTGFGAETRGGNTERLLIFKDGANPNNEYQSNTSSSLDDNNAFETFLFDGTTNII